MKTMTGMQKVRKRTRWIEVSIHVRKKDGSVKKNTLQSNSLLLI